MSNGNEVQTDIRAGTERAMVDHRPPSCTEKLKQERLELQKRCDEIDSVLAKLEANPTVAGIIDELSVLGRSMF